MMDWHVEYRNLRTGRDSAMNQHDGGIGFVPPMLKWKAALKTSSRVAIPVQPGLAKRPDAEAVSRSPRSAHAHTALQFIAIARTIAPGSQSRLSAAPMGKR